jgi:hypothetical protein
MSRSSRGQPGAQALVTSGWLAFVTASSTAAMAAVVAVIVVRGTGPGRQAMDALSVLPNAIPAIVLAVGVILAWNSPFLPVTLYGTAAILLIAYAAILLPYPIRYAVARLRQIGGSLDDAARVAGATGAADAGPCPAAADGALADRGDDAGLRHRLARAWSPRSCWRPRGCGRWAPSSSRSSNRARSRPAWP